MDDSLTLTAKPLNSADDLALYNYSATIEAFLSSLDLKPRTIEAYRKGLLYFFEWLSDEGITSPTRADIKRYKASLMEVYKVSTVASYLAAVRCFFRGLSREAGNPALNIADGISAPKQSKFHKKDALTADQARHVLELMPNETVADKRDRAIITLMLYAGLRTVEVTRLNVCDIREGINGARIDIWGKGRDSADESLPLAVPALVSIQESLAARELSGHPVRNQDPLFTSVSNRDYGGRMVTRSVSRICKDSFKRAGYDSDRITAHSLRHTTATLGREAGLSLYELQLLMRHRNPATTEIYIHETETTLNNAISKLEGVLA